MSKIDIYVGYAERIANDDYHGYSQSRRVIAETPEEVEEIRDGDCSTIVLNGLTLAEFEMGNATYTGNMLAPILAAGFKNIASLVNLRTGAGLKRGDILLRPKTSTRNGHTAIMIDETRLVQAQYDYDSKSGDSGGNEIKIKPYYDSPFTYVLRYEEVAHTPIQEAFIVRRLLKPLNPNMAGEDIKWLQKSLTERGYNLGRIDGSFGDATESAVRSFQSKNRLTSDGIAGRNTVTALGGKYVV